MQQEFVELQELLKNPSANQQKIKVIVDKITPSGVLLDAEAIKELDLGTYKP